jgi:hypothetical protein
MARSHNAYAYGCNAYVLGIPFKRNPYKSPKLVVGWALGWTDTRDRLKDPATPKYLKRKIRELARQTGRWK